MSSDKFIRNFEFQSPNSIVENGRIWILWTNSIQFYKDKFGLKLTFTGQKCCFLRTKVLCAAFLYLCFGFVTNGKVAQSTFVQKIVNKMLMKLTPLVYFTNIFTSSFYTRSSQKCKNSVKLSVSFYAFWDLRAQKLLVERWWNWLLVTSNACDIQIVQNTGKVRLTCLRSNISYRLLNNLTEVLIRTLQLQNGTTKVI